MLFRNKEIILLFYVYLANITVSFAGQNNSHHDYFNNSKIFLYEKITPIFSTPDLSDLPNIVETDMINTAIKLGEATDKLAIQVLSQHRGVAKKCNLAWLSTNFKFIGDELTKLAECSNSNCELSTLSIIRSKLQAYRDNASIELKKCREALLN